MKILYFDDQIAVCVKPVGMDSEHQLPRCLSEALTGDFWPVHRLDKNVGGVMVYARTKSSSALLSRLIQSGAFVKEYVAIVHGMPPSFGDWTDLLWKDSSKNKVYVVKRIRAGVKEARLVYRRIQEGDSSFVHIRLYTGRSHQIRVQFASRGYPLVGDRKYGSKAGINAPMLFSCKISFPYQGELRTFSYLPEWGAHVSLIAFE